MFHYWAYNTHKVQDAVEYYRLTNGVMPTVIVTRPEYKIVGETTVDIIQTRLGCWGMMLLSHLLTPDEINHLRMTVEPPPIPTRPLAVNVHSAPEPDLPKKPPIKRHKHGSRMCPHCQQEIDEFNNLGWWWGWEQGREPPYWDELRLFVFKRDGYNCQVCRKQFAIDDLQCHHIKPKEAGGTDSARNLTTLCAEHHLDPKPIMA